MKYTGGCHCGKIRYEVDVDLKSVISCNCSMCAKKGTLLAFTPADQFSLLSGKENLTDYQFNQKVIHHYFCNTCGVTSFAMGAMPDGTKMAAINARCLDNVELKNLSIQEVEGKNF